MRSERLDEAKKLAAGWQAQREDEDRNAALMARFSDATPEEVIAMWMSGRNERGQKLTRFEVQALGERWVVLFGDLPPDVSDGHTNDGCRDQPAPREPEPEDDTMLHMPDVVRLTGISDRTISRMVEDGRFPRPLHLSPRRIGWLARDVKAWVNRLEEQRSAPRQ